MINLEQLEILAQKFPDEPAYEFLCRMKDNEDAALRKLLKATEIKGIDKGVSVASQCYRLGMEYGRKANLSDSTDIVNNRN